MFDTTHKKICLLPKMYTQKSRQKQTVKKKFYKNDVQRVYHKKFVNAHHLLEGAYQMCTDP